jgi:hypothetical protein
LTAHGLEAGRLRVVLAPPPDQDLETLLSSYQGKAALELWRRLATQLARLMVYLTVGGGARRPLCFGIESLRVNGDRLVLIDRGWQALLESDSETPEGGAELFYLNLFRDLMGRLLTNLESRGCSTTSLLWLLQRRYGRLQELVEALKEDATGALPRTIDIAPLETFEIPRVAEPPSLGKAFLSQPRWAVFTELAALGTLCLAILLLLFAPPPRLPDQRLYLRTEDKVLILDTVHQEVVRSWSLPEPAWDLVGWAGSPRLLTLQEGSSMVHLLDAATGKPLGGLLLPSRLAPQRLVSFGSGGFLAVAPGTAVLGEVEPALKALAAFPVGSTCRALLATESGAYLADDGFLRRYDSTTGEILAQAAMVGVEDLALAGAYLAVLRAGGELVVLDALTLNGRSTIVGKSSQPPRLFSLTSSLVALADQATLSLVRVPEGRIETTLTLPESIVDGTVIGSTLWMIGRSGKILQADWAASKVQSLPLKQRVVRLVR